MSAGAEAEVLFSVVQAIVVYVVDDKVRRGAGNLSVHESLLSFSISYGITSVVGFYDAPVVAAEAGEIFGIDDREFILCERQELCAFGQCLDKLGSKQLFVPGKVGTAVVRINDPQSAGCAGLATTGKNPSRLPPCRD